MEMNKPVWLMAASGLMLRVNSRLRKSEKKRLGVWEVVAVLGLNSYMQCDASVYDVCVFKQTLSEKKVSLKERVIATVQLISGSQKGRT